MDSLSRKELENIIESSLRLDRSKGTLDQDARPFVIGSLLRGIPAGELEILNLAGARFGYRHVGFSLDSVFTMSTEDIVAKAQMVSPYIDTLVTGFIDEETFGYGRSLSETLSNTIQVPLVSMMDDIYAPQPALGLLSTIWGELGNIEGRRIAISWGYGSRFTHQNLAHSLLTLGAKLGAEMVVASPPEFSLMRRIIRNAEQLAEENNGSLVEATEFSIPSINADVVVGLNWTSLDDFSYPDKVADKAKKYKHWHFTKSLLGGRSLFITEPPIQTDLLASMDLIQSRNNLTPKALGRRIQVLVQSIRFVSQLSAEGLRASLI
ncbi:MAG: hypothetical protein EAX81_01385 [Candidatus Thorarchaeota archaeon]|nr:hypothetical protein [Candidatus Thorarchaeota archaeon]